jgi:hypothetical protein
MPPTATARHGTPSRWRSRCRCSLCTRAHNDDTRTWRRTLVEAGFPAKVRRRVLRLCASGHAPADAASRLGLHVQAVWGYARSHPEWLAALDQALLAGRNPNIPHGTPTGYRHWKCRCHECRSAHHGEAGISVMATG